MNVAIDNAFSGRVRRAEPMSRHTSWHVGGPAEVFFTPADRADLVAFLRSAPAELAITFVGLGSNLLVRDGGLPGIVIGMQGTLDALERIGETRVLRGGRRDLRAHRPAVPQVGTGTGGVFRRHSRNPRRGAGDERGCLRRGDLAARGRGRDHRPSWHHAPAHAVRLPQSAIAASYRRSPTSGSSRRELQLRAARRDEADEVKKLLERRRASQPIGEWSCGSVFTNPPNDHAARLIEVAGSRATASAMPRCHRSTPTSSSITATPRRAISSA